MHKQKCPDLCKTEDSCKYSMKHPSQKLSPTASIVEGYNIESVVKVHKQKCRNMCITQKNLICKEKSDVKSPVSYLYK